MLGLIFFLIRETYTSKQCHAYACKNIIADNLEPENVKYNDPLFSRKLNALRKKIRVEKMAENNGPKSMRDFPKTNEMKTEVIRKLTEKYLATTDHKLKKRLSWLFEKKEDGSEFLLKQKVPWGLRRCERCEVYWNRDTNSALNILLLMEAILKGEERPLVFQRRPSDPKESETDDSKDSVDKKKKRGRTQSGSSTKSKKKRISRSQW
ncbi:hypothetical protein RCL1_006406 [Eukaryota sp. TZLM3-RCL]